jgi:DNA gyrase subunit A
MGKYHPHGDASIYDTLTRMAQPFSLRYPLVDGQGNFGSIDDDPPAAMRYTEARLSRIATEMLRDIDADTVDFEPELRRVAQGADGAAVPASRTCSSTARPGSPSGWRRTCRRTGSARIVDAIVQLIDKPDSNVDDLMKHVKGPDFPTGSIIVGRQGIRDAYRTGRGRIVMRARAHIEELRGGKTAIIVTELPVRRQEGRRLRRDQEDRRPRPGEGDHRGLRSRRPLRPDGHADPDRAEARRDPAGRLEQALQAHAAAGDRSATTPSR